MTERNRGVTLLETMIAVSIALIGVLGVGRLIFLTTISTKNQGTETTRSTIYAQDKIEALLSLASVPTTGTTASFAGCTTTGATQQATYPACNTTGISATSWYTGLLAGGSTSPLQLGCPSAGSANIGYMDFLDVNGNQLTGATCAAAYTSGLPVGYVREWAITDANTFGTNPALKQITVAVYSISYFHSVGPQPIVVLTSYVSNPN